MQDDAADNLHGKMLHPQYAPRSLPAGGKRIRQDIVKRFPVCEPLPERRGHGLQLLIRFSGVCFLQGKHLIPQGKNALYLLCGIVAKQFF